MFRVAALSRYLAVRGAVDGSLFLCDDASPLSPARVNSWLRTIMLSQFFQSQLSDWGVQFGILDHVIKALGRGSSEWYMSYIRLPPLIRVRVGTPLGEGFACLDSLLQRC